MSSRPAVDDAASAVRIPDHTLMKVIGRGSYGEVWLARNVMGTLRAVKIVRRAAFDSDRPYLREFEGIRRCEPVSRAHDGLIDILHMGRNDDEGWFYYVMELADDACAKAPSSKLQEPKKHQVPNSKPESGAEGGASLFRCDRKGSEEMAGGPDPPRSLEPGASVIGGCRENSKEKVPGVLTSLGSLEPGACEPGAFSSYTPSTLAARLTCAKPLEVTECLRLAESLAGALAFLHEQGLIHRDVKPSNILYAGGMPKLGDIGLVAEAGSSRSFVGTEGFVPLEGPGTERADIFALGKVLYEALTGMDRSKFPRLPPDWTQAYDFDQRVELNEIVLRACEGDTVRRYHSAREMLADVALIASGRSVRKMRGMERRMRLLKWIAGSVAVLALAALSVSAVWQHQAGRERDLRIRAEQAEHAEREARLKAMLNQVNAARHDRSPGAVTQALGVAAEATALQVTPDLRNDAIFLLSRPDFVMREDLQFTFTHPVWVIDAASGLMAEMPKQTGGDPRLLSITLSTAGAPDKRRTLTVPDAPARLSLLEFTSGGQRLLITGEFGPGVVLETATGEVLHREPLPSSYPHGTPLSFCGSTGENLIRRSHDGGLALYSLPDGKRRSTPQIPDWPVRDQRLQRQRLWPSPDGRFVLLIDAELELSPLAGILSSLLHPTGQTARGAACLVETEVGSVVWKIAGPDEQVAAWSPDGTRIAVRAGERILSLDAATGETAAIVPQRIINRGTQLVFLESRNVLAFSTWSLTGICDLAREVMLGRPAVLERWSYSPERGLLFGGTGTAEWRPSPVMRTLHPPLFRQASVFCSFSPDEKWLITGLGGQFSWWDMESCSAVPSALTPARTAGDVLFAPDGKSAQFLTNGGRHEAPWDGAPLQSLPVAHPYGPGASHCSAFVSASADGNVVAFGGFRYIIVRRNGEEPRTFPTGDSGNPLSLSPDGRWLAVGAQHAEGIRIFDLHNDDAEPARVEPGGPGCGVAFSPDGQWLACSGSDENRVLRTGTWEVVHRRPRHSRSLLGHVSFSRDSKLMSVKDTPSRCAIIQPGTWRTLFQLDSPTGEIFERCALSPGGRYFAAAGARQELHVWDLKAMARELNKLNIRTD